MGEQVISCPKCQQRLIVPESIQQFSCPICKTLIRPSCECPPTHDSHEGESELFFLGEMGVFDDFL